MVKDMGILLKVWAIWKVYENNTIKSYKVLQMSKMYIYYFVIYIHSCHSQYPIKLYSITIIHLWIF